MQTLAYPTLRSATRLRSARVSSRWIGAAGLGYVIAAGVENMELLRAPTYASSAETIRAAYTDRVVAGITTGAGALSLVLYVLFVLGLSTRPRDDRWRTAALIGGLAGPALAAVGVAAAALLAAPGAESLSDAATRSLSDLQLTLRMLAGPLMALFLVATAAGGALPRPLAAGARVVAVPLALTPLAAASGATAVVAAASVAFGLQSLWIWLVSLHLCTEGAERADRVRRAAFLMLVLAAGLVGIALLAVPEATGSFFAWELEPAPLAAFAGGLYVGSAVVYAAGLRVPLAAVRSLLAAAVVLSVSVFAITLVHLDIFDLERLQAWAWLVLFAGFAAATIALLARRPGAARPAGVPLAAWARWALATAAVALGALGLALWIDPVATGAAGPFALPTLGGRFAGSWIVMLGVLAAWGAVLGRRDEARLPALALIALPAGAFAAALRTGELDAAYLAALTLLAGLGLAVRAAAR